MTRGQETLIYVQPRTVVRWWSIIAGLLLVAHLVVVAVRFGTGHPYVFGLVPLFDLDEESNVPTCFSSFLILFCAVLVAVIAIVKRRQQGAFVRQWTALAGILLYLSIDEASGIHELLSLPTQRLIDTRGPLYYAWVVPGVILVIVFAISFWRFVWHLPLTTRRLFFLSAAVFLVGALGIELLGGWQNFLHGRSNVTYRLLAMVEEGFEMAGMLLFAYALLDYWCGHVGVVSFQVGGEAAARSE